MLTFYRTEGSRIIDFEITLKATDGPVTFGDTKEGMFGLRVASSMDVNKKKGGKITNAEGLTDDQAWGKASPWVDYTGPVEGKTVGIAILNHPRSFRYPTTWHVRTYGLFAANPFGWHDFGLGEVGEYTLPGGRVDPVRLPGDPARGRHRRRRISRSAFEAYAERTARSRSAPIDVGTLRPSRDDPGRGGDPVERHVVRLDGKLIDDLAVEPSAQRGASGRSGGRSRS